MPSVVSLGEYEIYWLVLAGFVAVMVVGTIIAFFKK